ncbi:MAG TPA: cytochrome P450 [Kutzneria sp.]|jgi:cytochrome P450
MTEALDFPFGDYDRLNPSSTESADDPVRVRLPHGGEAWLVRRHDHVRAVLSDPRFSRARTIGSDIPRSTEAIPSDTFPNLLSMDPPDHTRLRRIGAKALSARGIAAYEPHVQRVIDDCLDRMTDLGPPADLMAHFAWPVAITVMCQFLGVPVEDRATFGHWADVEMTVTQYSRAEIMAARHQMQDYIRQLVKRRQSEPADDFLTVLVQAGHEEDLSEDEIVGFGSALLTAGYETTANQFGLFLYVLLTHPDELARLRSDPGLLDAAVEELLRFVPFFESAVIPQPRMATADVEVGGVTIRAGECVYADLGIAGRDPLVFERPDELDLARPVNPHVAFGHGIHHCIGAPLARLELRIGLGTLLRRLPGVQLAVEESDLTWLRGGLMRGLETLPLTW